MAKERIEEAVASIVAPAAKDFAADRQAASLIAEVRDLRAEMSNIGGVGFEALQGVEAMATVTLAYMKTREAKHTETVELMLKEIRDRAMAAWDLIDSSLEQSGMSRKAA